MTSPDSFSGMSDDDLRRLATVLQQSGLSFDPVTMRKATVTAVDLTSAPPVVSVQLSGDTTTTITGVRLFRAYIPVVGDTTLILKQGKDVLALGTVASASYEKDYVRYSRTSTFTCGSNVNEKVAFNIADVTDTSIVTVASSTDFTLVRAGKYGIDYNAPFAASATGSRLAWIGLASSSTTRYRVQSGNPNNGSACIIGVALTRRFAAGTVLSAYAYQDSGANLTLFPTTTTGPLDINFAYLGP